MQQRGQPKYLIAQQTKEQGPTSINNQQSSVLPSAEFCFHPE